MDEAVILVQSPGFRIEPEATEGEDTIRHGPAASTDGQILNITGWPSEGNSFFFNSLIFL